MLTAAAQLTCYVVPGELSSPRFGWAFAQGLMAAEREIHGAVTDENRLREGDVALFGSPARWDLVLAARAAGRTWYYGDKGYFRRGEYFRITKNAFMPTVLTAPPPGAYDRARAVGAAIRPWRRDGRHILVCPPGQVHADLMRRAGLDIARPDDWGAWAKAELAAYTDRPVRIRSKADAARPLEADLADCWAVVAYMSNVAVEAALLGVPVFVLGPSAAAPIARTQLRDIECPVYPDNRHVFAAWLASQQWTLDEIAAGDAWRSLRA